MVEPFVIAGLVASISSLVTQAILRRRRKQRETEKKLSPSERLEKHVAEMRKKDPVFAVQNPETEELRAIYRQLDEELMLADEVKTPPPPIVLQFERDQSIVDRFFGKPPKRTGKPRPGTVIRRGPPDPDNLMLGHGGLPHVESLEEERKRKMTDLVNRLKEGGRY